MFQRQKQEENLAYESQISSCPQQWPLGSNDDEMDTGQSELAKIESGGAGILRPLNSANDLYDQSKCRGLADNRLCTATGGLSVAPQANRSLLAGGTTKNRVTSLSSGGLPGRYG